MNDISQDEDKRLADRLIKFAEIIRSGGAVTWGDEIAGFADDLDEAAAFINRFRSDD